jgi:cob(I)alamin adenosyltransferase
MKIYTKTGDKGKTGLLGGERVSKFHDRINLYGEIDELNSCIGMLLSSSGHLLTNEEKLEILATQKELFKLGSLMASEPDQWKKFSLPQLSEKVVLDLEVSIDSMEEQCETLKNFILPGGSVESSWCQICRTTTRKVERSLVYYFEKNPENIPQGAMTLLNRMSDYFFVLARFFNKKLGHSEILWSGRD